MTAEELSAYYALLRKELNPTIFVTEAVSFRLMNVEWSIFGSLSETTETCISEIREVLAARGFNEELVLEIVSMSKASEALRGDFMRAWNSPVSLAKTGDVQGLAQLAVYCFSHIIFKYER
jgi:hypothetical protein